MAIESTSGAVSRERIRVADRLERAIDERAKVEEEIARGERKQSSRPSLRRTVFWLALMGVSLYLVAPSVLEVVGWASYLVVIGGFFIRGTRVQTSPRPPAASSPAASERASH